MATNYYPYGMPMAGNYMPSDANKKLYNAGSEWQDEFSGIIDYYSTFFREYDPVIGRFNGVDPKAEITVELSIYHYSGNNPVNFNDPMGDEEAGGGDYSQWWRTFLTVAYLGSNPSGTYHFENGEFTWFERISKGTASSMLRELGDFVSRFNEIEEEVRRQINLGKEEYKKDPNGTTYQKYYLNAYHLIIDKYNNAFQNVSKFQNKFFLGFGNYHEVKPVWVKGFDGKNELKFDFVLSVPFLNEFAEGKTSFEGLVSGIYHEYLHIYTYFPGFGHPDLLNADNGTKEFYAYFHMVNGPGLPALSDDERRQQYNNALTAWKGMGEEYKDRFFSKWISIQLFMFRTRPR